MTKDELHNQMVDGPLVEPLTRRERDVLTLLAQGYSGPEIAEKLTLGLSSVKSYTQHLYGKLGVSSKRQAVSRAQALGLLEPALGAPKPAEGWVVAAGPAGRAASAPLNNLPVQLTHFIGRDIELVDLKRLLEGDARLVTLTGPGGTGKTRLALQAAAASLRNFPDGAWLVDLAPVAQPALVASAVAQALGVQVEAGQTPAQTVAKRLRGQHVLLILDNCEHLVTACAELAEHLLQAVPRLTILATSREPLGVQGENTYPVLALSLPGPQPLAPAQLLAASEAARLFVERATAARPDFSLSAANAAAVAQICQRLDGIPLALELAAARVRALSVEQIAERLSDRFRLLAGGSRTAPARQQTLSGTIDWSYDLLSEPERELLRQLAVFAGGWTLEAAEQVGAGTGDVLDLLAQLVSKSLVLSEQQPGQAARFRMLETIREYAREKLARAGEAQAARNRHLGFYVALAEQAMPGLRHHRQVEWLAQLETEADNLRAALTWALEQEDAQAALRMTGALCEYWWMSERENVEHFEWLSAALRLPASQGALQRSAWRARALMGAGWVGQYTELATRRAWLEESLSIYRELGDRAGAAEVLMHLPLDFELSPQRAAEGIPFLEESLEIWVELGDPWGIGACLHDTAFVLNALGNRSKAIEYYRRSVPMRREAGDRFGVMGALNALAQYTWLSGESAAARGLFDDNLAISKDKGDKGSMRYALRNLFEISIAQGRYDQAREEVVAIQMTARWPREPASDQMRLGQLDYWQGRLAEARARFEAALEVFQALSDSNGISWAPAWLGCVAYRAGDLAQAQALMEAGLAIYVGAPSELIFALLCRADVARAQGDLAHAAEMYARGLKLAMDQGGQPDLPPFLEALAKLALATARPDRAARLLGAADALRTRIGMPIPPVEQADYDQALAQARDQLGPEAFEAVWAEGRALDWKQAAAYALET